MRVQHSDEAIRAALARGRALAELRRTSRLDFFAAYPRQFEFFAAGANHNERGLVAANRVGKSEAGAFEMAVHLTGEYPGWWPGHRGWRGPIRAWACGLTGELVRNIQQTKLCGPYGVAAAFGTGLIPKEAFADRPTMSRGVSDAYDTVWVKWRDGRGRVDETAISSLTFKTYREGREAYQGDAVHVEWFDEEPPADVYDEGRTRLRTTRGVSYATFTPLQGETDLYIRLTDESAPNRHVTRMGMADAPHFTVQDIEEAVRDCPKYLIPARIYGEPAMGSGRIFTHDEEDFAETYPEVPEHWRKLWGIDFGIGHPFAAVLCAWDVEADCIHVLAEVKVRDALPTQHVPMMRAIAAGPPVAWPHDGTHRDRGHAEVLADHYRDPMPGMPGLRMLEEHATWPEGGFSTEAAILDMDERLRTNRIKVAKNCREFFAEYRSYHRDDKGVVVPRGDDLLSAFFKCLMMKRFARPGPLQPARRRSYGFSRLPDAGETSSTQFDLFTGQPAAP